MACSTCIRWMVWNESDQNQIFYYYDCNDGTTLLSTLIGPGQFYSVCGCQASGSYASSTEVYIEDGGTGYITEEQDISIPHTNLTKFKLGAFANVNDPYDYTNGQIVEVVNAISENLGLPIKVAESIVERVKNTFSVAYSWIESFQNKAKEEHAVCDIFGKKRIFLEKEYKARNFVVQSPAAIFCLEKLIQLYKSLNGKAKIAYNVHDGYMLYSTRDNLKDVILESQSVLLSKSHLFPDMHLNVSCYAGRKLSDLKKININKRE